MTVLQIKVDEVDVDLWIAVPPLTLLTLALYESLVHP